MLDFLFFAVALYMSAWIEIIVKRKLAQKEDSRTLHGYAGQHGKCDWLVVMVSDCTF